MATDWARSILALVMSFRGHSLIRPSGVIQLMDSALVLVGTIKKMAVWNTGK
jgi:hypothetical protein